MHKDEVAALDKDFKYVLAKITALEERVRELEGQSAGHPPNITVAAGVSNRTGL